MTSLQTVNRVRIVFSYMPASEFSYQTQNIALRCEVVTNQEQKDAVFARESLQDGIEAQSFLCRPSEEAVSAKISWFAENLAYQYRSANGTPAEVQLNRAS